MESKSKIWCIISAIINILSGIGFCFTLILIPLGIFCFIAAKRYFAWAECSDVELINQKDSLRNWAIFTSIVNFPIGLISIIPLVLCDNNVSVSNVKDAPTVHQTSEEVVQETEKKEEVDTEFSELETLKKLADLKAEGLITEEEYERAKSEVLNKR